MAPHFPPPLPFATIDTVIHIPAPRAPGSPGGEGIVNLETLGRCFHLVLGLGFVSGALLTACQGRAPAGSSGTGGAGTTGEDPAAAPFEDVTEAVGLDFRHESGAAGDLTLIEVNGSGGGMLDYDNDGDLDLYLLQGHKLPRTDPAADPPMPPPPPGAPLDRLYRNDLVVRPDGTRELRFTDVTESSGIRATGYGLGLATGDYDNDGWVDLYVTNWGPNQLWRNKGDGTFEDVTAAAGVGDPRWSSSAAWVDYDRDGWLDLAVVNYVDLNLANHRPCISPTSGRVDYCGPKSYNAVPGSLYHNRGDGTFEDVSVKSGFATAYGPGLGVVASDFDLDGWPEIYVANDGAENQLWMNRAGQRFENEARARGAAVNRSGLPEAGMGVVAADLSGDGRDDLFITHLNRETNTLYASDASGVFEDKTRASGLGPPSWPFTGFGVGDLDYDNDGWQDLFTTNGEVKTIIEQKDAGDPLPLKQTNQLFRNRGDGTFEDLSAASGPPFNTPDVGRGLAQGDVDNDGDTDVLITYNSAPARLYLNRVGAARPWLGLRLVGGDPPRDQLGARVELLGNREAPFVRHAHTDGSYLSANDPRVLLGLGDNDAYQALRVTWPTGEVEEWAGLETGRYHTLKQGEGSPAGSP